MDAANSARELGELLLRLRATDRDHRVFGSGGHRYQMGPVLSERELGDFERTQGIRLPEEYRSFLLIVGNGGAGPFFGLEPLGAFGRDLTKAFPFSRSTESRNPEELEPAPPCDRDDYPGILELCHQGCGTYSYLVVNGPAYGQMWIGREAFYPTKFSFAPWYRRWAELALRTLENQKLLPLLRLGMSKADVISETGGDWKSRQALGRPTWFFEAPGIPAQLELDEGGLVVKVNPWPFITASPS